MYISSVKCRVNVATDKAALDRNDGAEVSLSRTKTLADIVTE